MSLQLTELHYRTSPSLDVEAIVQRAETLTRSGIETSGSWEPGQTILLFHSRHSIQYEDGSAPAQTAILPADKRSTLEQYADAVQQSWACADAAERIQRCTCCYLISEMMARALPPLDRLKLFHGVLQAVVEITNPHAMVFLHSQQVIAPEAYLESCTIPPIQRPGSLNVRFFNIDNSEHGDMIMDTRGLADIGLHDLQCHFRGLDPNDVARVLYNTAFYIAENGPVIQSGQTIQGTTADSKWRCQFEEALLEPQRKLLDLNPGPPFAAGIR